MKTFNKILEEEKQKDYFKKLELFIQQAYQNKIVYPPYSSIYQAFQYVDLNEIKVVILGQDPYHEKHQANGLAFSVYKDCVCPPSLRNIFKELENDLNIKKESPDLTSWAKQGVLLLNTVLTVEEGKANSHKNQGWEIFTDKIIEYLGQKEIPCVFILWGKQAQMKKRWIHPRHLVIESSHPSPLSAYRGFFNSHPFSKTNQFLIENGINPIDWGRE